MQESAVLLAASARRPELRAEPSLSPEPVQKHKLEGEPLESYAGSVLTLPLPPPR